MDGCSRWNREMRRRKFVSSVPFGADQMVSSVTEMPCAEQPDRSVAARIARTRGLRLQGFICELWSRPYTKIAPARVRPRRNLRWHKLCNAGLIPPVSIFVEEGAPVTSRAAVKELLGLFPEVQVGVR